MQSPLLAKVEAWPVRYLPATVRLPSWTHSMEGHVDSCVDALLDHPCSLNIVNAGGESPLHTAAWTANNYAIKRLLRLAPKLAWQQNNHNMTPLERVEHLIENSEALETLANELRKNGRRAITKQELIAVFSLLEQAPVASQ